VAVKSYGSSKASITKTANGFNTATNSHNTAAERERVVLPPNGDEWPTRALSFAVDRRWWAMLVLTRLRG